MSINYKNIIASTTTSLNKSDDEIYAHGNDSLSSLSICNTSATNATKINLILNSRSLYDESVEFGVEPTYLPKETYYILKNLELPVGVTIVLNKEELEYDTQRYNLDIYSTHTIDIIIK